jgi:SAM-dependent methyltransferase
VSCCPPPEAARTDVNGLGRLFRGPVVARERRRFERRGLEARQRALLREGAPERVLDIGCGVGALGLTCLARGSRHADFVEVSPAYLAAARELAQQRGVMDRATFSPGDALTLELAPADLVLLDRVVCCHPEGPALLARAAALSRGALAFSYPAPSLPARLGGWLLNGVMRLLRHPYRFFLHDERALLGAASSSGHRLASSSRHGIWQVRVYRRGSRGEISP